MFSPCLDINALTVFDFMVSQQVWVIKPKEVYLNPGLIEVLRSAFFSTSTAFGHKYKAHYKSSHPTRLEPELTMSLVALAATGVCSSPCFSLLLLMFPTVALCGAPCLAKRDQD